MDTVSVESRNGPIIIARDLRPLLCRYWKVSDAVDEGLVVFGEEGHGRVYITNMLNQYDFEPPGRMQLLFDFSSEEFVKEVLKVTVDDPNLIVDNDFGTVLPGDQFVAKLRAEPKWRWR